MTAPILSTYCDYCQYLEDLYYLSKFTDGTVMCDDCLIQGTALDIDAEMIDDSYEAYHGIK